MIPLLPGTLLDHLDAPVPILVGVTQESFEILQSEYDFDSEYMESKTWVFLDEVTADVRTSSPE